MPAGCDCPGEGAAGAVGMGGNGGAVASPLVALPAVVPVVVPALVPFPGAAIPDASAGALA